MACSILYNMRGLYIIFRAVEVHSELLSWMTEAYDDAVSAATRFGPVQLSPSGRSFLSSSELSGWNDVAQMAAGSAEVKERGSDDGSMAIRASPYEGTGSPGAGAKGLRC